MDIRNHAQSGHSHGAHSHADRDDHAHAHADHAHGAHAHEGHQHPTHRHAHAHASGDACCADEVVDELASDSGSGRTFWLQTMDCSAEESEIRRALEPIGGIRSLRFRLGARTLTVDADEAVLPEALRAIRRAGFDPKPVEPVVSGAAAQTDGSTQPAGSGLPRLVAALLLATGAELLSFFAPEGMAWKVGGMVVAAAAIALAGLDTYKKGGLALIRGRLNINALMTVAVTGAFLLGEWPEAAMVMALYAIAELIEARAVDRARNAVQGLMAMAPDVALVKQSDGAWASMRTAEVSVGSTIRIKPGERVPLDGLVVSGSSAVDQSPVTGESLPVDKGVGDELFAGTINQAGELEFRSTSVASNSTLARIMQAVEQAQGSRAPIQRFVDRFAAVYTPAVFVLAVLVAVLGHMVFGLPFAQAAYKALVLLVIACPCALVISTPVTVVSGLAAAARRGILIKGGIHLEGARLIKVVALDKTGTVTEGKPKLVHWENLTEADVGAVAASLAERSDHPVSQAIAAGLAGRAGEVSDFEAVPGYGVQATLDGQTYLLGNHRLVHERGLCSAALEARLAEHERQGRTVTLLATPERTLALFAVADTIKSSSREAIAQLQRLGLSPVMLTGDNQTTAEAIGAQAGISDVRGNLLPQDKQSAIVELQGASGKTAMVGDGINDAPSLAQADIGFAMGGAGTDVAVEAADVVVMTDDLRRVATTVELSRKTHAVLWQNISLALGIKAVFLVLAITGSATMWMAVFADMGASLLVVMNGLRLLRRS